MLQYITESTQHVTVHNKNLQNIAIHNRKHETHSSTLQKTCKTLQFSIEIMKHIAVHNRKYATNCITYKKYKTH